LEPSIGSLGGVVGIGVALQNGLPLARAKASRQWQSTIGRIRSAQVAYYSVPTGRGGSYSGYAPSIDFEYTVGEEHFERTAYVDGGSRNFDSVDEVVRRCRSGQKVTVRYDSAHPDRAVVEGEYLGGSEVLTFFGCIICAFAALIIVSSL